MSSHSTFEAIQAKCLSLPDSVEEYPWEHVGWKVGGKLFCIGSQNEGRITVKSTREKQQALIQHPDIEIAAYVGRFGWVAMNVIGEDGLELALELIEESYSLVAPKRRLRKPAAP